MTANNERKTRVRGPVDSFGGTLPTAKQAHSIQPDHAPHTQPRKDHATTISANHSTTVSVSSLQDGLLRQQTVAHVPPRTNLAACCVRPGSLPSEKQNDDSHGLCDLWRRPERPVIPTWDC